MKIQFTIGDATHPIGSGNKIMVLTYLAHRMSPFSLQGSTATRRIVAGERFYGNPMRAVEFCEGFSGGKCILPAHQNSPVVAGGTGIAALMALATLHADLAQGELHAIP